MATADTGSFRVHLQSLVDFARELENQLDALRRPADRLTVLGGRPLALGQFVPALPMAQRHVATADQMQDLLVGVRHAVAFAEEVTRTIATEYARHDEQIAASFRSLGTEAVVPTPAGGTVYVSQTVRNG
ncbi:hypothetical protein O7627_09295 [Solwaraspora sp. WMMD1047]|uniref:hypothetical protein n=1 Tax=Solwaraspora sp. WMMD1047 TaxID=3016102 RepID=UPI0024159896|nr:hypothetical protein [Solwaraspora sp. WMMD1047]MDG4829496.1 hypothetical protein [Solwaraspora sp. WMMD1047]